MGGVFVCIISTHTFIAKSKNILQFVYFLLTKTFQECSLLTKRARQKCLWANKIVHTFSCKVCYMKPIKISFYKSLRYILLISTPKSIKNLVYAYFTIKADMLTYVTSI